MKNLLFFCVFPLNIITADLTHIEVINQSNKFKAMHARLVSSDNDPLQKIPLDPIIERVNKSVHLPKMNVDNRILSLGVKKQAEEKSTLSDGSQYCKIIFDVAAKFHVPLHNLKLFENSFLLLDLFYNFNEVGKTIDLESPHLEAFKNFPIQKNQIYQFIIHDNYIEVYYLANVPEGTEIKLELLLKIDFEQEQIQSKL